MREIILHEKHFWNNVIMKWNFFKNYIELNGAQNENHFHVSSTKNCNTLSNATGCPKLLQKICKKFSTCWIQICHQICSQTIPAIQGSNLSKIGRNSSKQIFFPRSRRKVCDIQLNGENGLFSAHINKYASSKILCLQN